MEQVRLGILGGGTVGGGVVQALRDNGPLLASRLGMSFEVRRVAVRDLGRRRKVPLPRRMLTTDWRAVIADPAVDVIVELVGGTGVAREMVEAALKVGKPVVTANKALISAAGPALFRLAADRGTNLYYEASVAGGIPIIKVLRESLVGNRIRSIHGIVNGTCNYILSRMKHEGADFGEVLADAQRLGYAEAEPSLDIDGHDAAHKTGILASLAYGFWVKPGEVWTEGIRHVSRLDIAFASKLGYTIKLLGVVKAPEPARGSAGESAAVQVSVYPALVPDAHVLASVNDVFNAVLVRGDRVGDALFYGRGAGQDATASSVLSDVADAALDLKHGSRRRVPPFVAHAEGVGVMPVDGVVSKSYVRLSVIDRPGVLARVASVLAERRIGISSVFQPEGHEGRSVPLVFMLHDAPNRDLSLALGRIARLPFVKGRPVMLRVETLDGSG